MSRVPRVALCLLLFVLLPTAAALAQTVPDSKYGAGGTKETTKTTHANGDVEKTTTWRDKSGTIREQDSDITATSGAETETHAWYDAKGDKTAEDADKWDSFGFWEYSREEDYTSGVLSKGDIWEYDPSRGEDIHKVWDPTLQKYVELKNKRVDILKNIGAFKQESLIGTAFYIGAAIKFEDDGNFFTAAGINGSYIQSIDHRLGLMIDGEWTRGMQNNQDLTKLQLLGGLATCEHSRNRISLQPHVLAGFSRVTPQQEPTAQATNSFAIAVGTDVSVRLNRSASVMVRADYNPTFAGGNVQNNFRLGVGLRYQF